GVFAPNSKHRALVTPAKQGKGNKPKAPDDGQDKTRVERRAAMSWAQRLKRVFNIDIETCQACGGTVRIIACIEDPVIVEKILTHLDKKDESTQASRLPHCRAPPPAGLFD
nr:IS91 family transposase [Desulfobacterales bacterium]